MKRLSVLNQANEYLDKNWKKLRTGNAEQYYYDTKRIYDLYLLCFYLSLREKIKKEVQENYRDKTFQEIADSIVEYDGYETIDFEYAIIHRQDIEPMIESYVRGQINKIENNTLKLEL